MINKRNDHIYIGETARTFRTRVLEHMKLLNNLDPSSFQLIHWMNKHKDDLICPEFKFKVVGQFKDALTRQITEAIYIMESGSLNKKCEFRINTLCRLEANISVKDQEKKRKERIDRQALEDKEIKIFIERLKTKTSQCKGPIIYNIIEFNCRSDESEKRGILLEEQELPQSKRRKKMSTFSTPRSNPPMMEDDSPVQILGITPIQKRPNSPDLINPDILESSGEVEKNEAGEEKTNLSNELRGKRIQPLPVETQEEEEWSLATETDMLVRSSIRLNSITEEKTPDVDIDPLSMNSFHKLSKRERSKSLSVLGKVKFNNLWRASVEGCDYQDEKQLDLERYKLTFGEGASMEVLTEPGTPVRPKGTPKRVLSPERWTPKGRLRKLSTQMMLESPDLRLNLVVTEENKLNLLVPPEDKQVNKPLDEEENTKTRTRTPPKVELGRRLLDSFEFNYGGKKTPNIVGHLATPPRTRAGNGVRGGRAGRKGRALPAVPDSQPLISAVLTPKRKVGDGTKVCNVTKPK